jgi:trk system potassium uptake protein TrkA
MRAVIVGCGRVGATMAQAMDAAGHEVTIVDLATRSFDRLPATFRGSAVRGDGTDEDTLRRAGAENADLFLALTEGDNRNVMAAQLALEALGIGRVFAKVNDPVRAEAYAELGIGTPWWVPAAGAAAEPFKARRSWAAGRWALPDQGAERVGPRGRPDGEGPRPRRPDRR